MSVHRFALDVLPLDDITLDWAHTYLLAWYGPDGHPYLTTWTDGPDSLYIWVVVTGPVLPFGPPMWDAPAPYKTALNIRVGNESALSLPPPLSCSAFTLHLVGPDQDWRQEARRLGGVRALGWYWRQGFQRGWHQEGCRKLHRLGERPCWLSATN